MRLLLLLVSLLAFGFGFGFAIGGHQQHKNVDVELRAKWSGTSLLLEMGELLAKENGNNLWKFIDGWLERESQLDKSDSSVCVGEIVSQGLTLVEAHLSSLVQLSLSLRAASPKLVVYKQLAHESLSSHAGKAEQWEMATSITPPSQSCCWVDVGSKLLVDDSQVVDWLKSADRSLSQQSVDLVEFDHVYPQHKPSPYTAVLYGTLGTTCFRAFHSLLREASEKGVARYVYRPVIADGCASDSCARVGTGANMNLAGYGVELALKNMEYKAIDDSEVKAAESSRDSMTEDLSQDVGGFIFSKLLERKPHLEGELMTFRDHLLSSEVSDAMNVWEVKDLGYQAAQRIVGASEPLRLMQELNQNFPNLVSSLSRMKLNEIIKDEIESNQQMVAPGKNILAVNGALVNPDKLDAFTLLHIIHEELSFADKLSKIKVPKDSIRQFMRLSEPAQQNVIRLDFRSEKLVHYVNDLEKDETYRRWSANLQELLMPTFPGHLRYIRKNLYHAVYVADPASVEGLKAVEMISRYLSHNLPFRFGLILLSPEHVKCLKQNSERSSCTNDLSSLVIRLFLHVKEQNGALSAFKFLNNINFEEDDDFVEESQVEEAFINSFRTLTKPNAMELFLKLKRGNDYQSEAFESSEFVLRLGLSDMHPSLLMNGLVYGPSQARFETVIMAMNEELPRIQEGVYYGNIHSQTDVLDKFLSEEGYTRYNPKLLESGKYFSLATLHDDPRSAISKLQYLHASGTEDDVKPVTHWLVVDLSQESGVRLLQEGLRYLMDGGSTQGRLAIINNVEGDLTLEERATSLLLVRAVNHVIQQPSRRLKTLRFLQELLSQYKMNEYNYQEAIQVISKLAATAGLNTDILLDNLKMSDTPDEHVARFQQERDFVYNFFGVAPGTNAVITNGKLVLPNEPIIAEDLRLLESAEYRRRSRDVQKIIESANWEGVEADDLTSDFLSSVIMIVSSTMASRVRSSDTANFELLKADHSAIVHQVDGSPLQIDAVINPLSAVGQRLTPLLLMLEEWVQPSMRIVLNPMSSLGDLPLKNFYRYVLPSKDNFLTPKARFTSMPLSKTLTMNLDVPEPWLVEPVVAIHDLDNIVLEKLENERTLHAVFELEALMITGHCYERNEPPRGLQLILGTKQDPHLVDTIVMANLGYFQLKASPGVWSLRLADGRSSELYTLQGYKEGTDEGPMSKQVVMEDLRGALVQLEAVRRKGKEHEKLLEETPTSKGQGQSKRLLEWAAGIIGKRGSNTLVRQGETINIFSVASGHLYERFLKIMMLSVLKNTKRPVKFWFIKNYLSPQFKDLIPHMANEYGFQYELVTYKWPTWLHKQTEKQRIIWAYKILFLDVIFPLSLKKVIFVDADQIIRTDMGELYDMDIKGKPLAYTPFCDNNKEMDGYRFWTHGFWKDHLQGKPYHISALYVVDLEKFRQTAAGDNLRVFYENLSKDPNSLSNLDQDLPNYAQHTVPIFSLPQEWLWCESWCGNATKARAKTIDLCNNPMTKEPKLQGAKRIVAEWPSLDNEARLFTNKMLGDEHANPPSPSHVEATSSVSEGKDEL